MNLQQPLLDALHKELELQKDYLIDKKISTIYFGGGTPSLLPVDDIKRLIEYIYQRFEVAAEAEITLEANPDDLNPGKLKELKQAGINRLSIGIQSFNDADLHFMNRAHNAVQAEQSVKDAQDFGFEDISIDLIYGSPGMSDESWQTNLDKTFSLGVPHLSAYCLTVEPRTALDSFIKKGNVPALDEEMAARHFKMLVEYTADKGYEHYEISNFALPGRYSRHNSSYWKGEHYLGLGPSAHSFNGTHRRWNIANNGLYIKALNEVAPFFEEEELTAANRYNEYLMTSLRTMWGVDMAIVEQRFGLEQKKYLELAMQPYLQSGHLELKDNKLALTAEGKFLSDGIISDLFEEE